ncbi:alpha-ketoacid dehydrogenase subunit alpha/beta [Microbulbifer pacificus]|uniref:Thiamine pyrophosphate-dependent enzyme n=1 Tax=Microbulbifer pacificus TaxID=407164 RepID=A0AAU0N235_9GAMM|nr:thiamine pyrophosphate-dependent enzyme [Microbulbifer pacificus]WOX07042.1 thiamine pyrophosphate-dependent enzyme [Microbulbifer pacificus]
MPTDKKLKIKSPWIELATTESDWSEANPVLLESMLSSMVLIRAFEEKVLALAGAGLVHGPAHSAIGQEGGAVGSALAMVAGDQINGSHRAHHQFLAKSLHFIRPEGISPRQAFAEDIREVVHHTLAEIMGLSQGYCKGRGGSMHLRWQEAGNLGTNAIVGGGVPFAAGSAWAHRHSQNGNAVFTYFGDGAVNIGSVLETMNLAAAWKLPVCFFIENNRYAVSTTVEESTAETRLSSRGSAFGIPSWRIDGMDPLAVYQASQQALTVMRSGGGPAIIEADVYRYFHQSGPLPGSAFGYRSKSEEEAWRARDPIDRVEVELIGRGLVSADECAELRRRASQLMDDVAEEFLERADGKARIKPELWPSPDFRDYGIRGDLSELQGVRTEELETFSGKVVDGRFVDVVADVMMRRMQEDERIVVMGEDVHRLKGGTNGATRGLSDAFPERVLGTPISENAFVGLAGGLAADGRYVPVVEFMYPDFMWVAADQVFNQIAKARHMFGGENAMPLVLRTKVAMGTGYGSQHCMDPAGIFATSVGWRIVAPSTPFDYVGLMNSALKCKDPVLVIEHVDLYSARGPAPEDDLDYFIPLGKARVVRHGAAMTILTYLSMVQVVSDAVERLGIDAEVIDLRSLDRAGLDWDTIGASIEKTGNVLIVEQGSIGTSYGGFLADQIQSRYFDLLDAPIQRVHGGEASPSVSKVLEQASCAAAADVERGIRSLLAERALELC